MNNWSAWGGAWPEPATYYLDPLHGNDSLAGTTPALAWLTYAKAEQTALTPGQSIAKKVDGEWYTFLSASRVPRAGAAGKVAMAYYQQTFFPVPLGDIDWTALTHVCHDHVEPNADGTLLLTYLDMTAANSASLIAAARAAGVKVLLTIADVGFANFTAAATNHLALFISNIISLATSRGYDGIDIDWERNIAQPIVNTFMSALYPAVKAINPNMLVTMTASFTDENGAPIDPLWAQAVNYFDYIDAMCYDMYPQGQCVTWFNSAMFDASFVGGPFEAPVTSSWKHIRSLVLSGVPPAKILNGIPFYGRLYAGNVGTPTSGPLAPRQSYPSAVSMTNTYTGYSAIPALYVAADEHWDGVGQVPFLSIVNANPTLNSYLTYDDPSSLTGKIDWVIQRGLGGVSCWELSLDYFSGRTIKSPLLNAVKYAFPKVPLAAGATPAAPASLTQQGVSASGATLSWAPMAAASTYNLKRSTTNGSGYATIAAVSGTSFTDATLSSGVTYYYIVTAVNNGTEGAGSAQVTVIATATTPPAAPTALAGSAATPTGVINLLQTTLTWTGSAALYLVKRSTQISGGPYTLIGTATTATFTDVLLAPNQSYYYVVTAVAGSIQSANSAELTVAAPAYVATNLLGSPSDISVYPWITGGTGTTVTSPTTLTAATSGITGLAQTAVAVSPTTDYIASITMSATASGFVTLSVYAPGYTPIPASAGQYVAAGTSASFIVPFNTLANTSVIFELDLDVNFMGATVTVTKAVVSVKLPGSTNMLPSPNAINISPWLLSGTGVVATGALTLLSATSGATSVAQQSIAVTPGVNYTATLTLACAVAGGFAVLSIYASAYASVVASQGAGVLATQVALTVNFNSGSQTAIVFELDVNGAAAGQVLTLSGISLAATPDAVQQW